MLAPHPELISADLEVPLATGGTARYVNLDNAASTAPLTTVVDAVNAALPWYSSVHRGDGFPSQVSTRLYEAARHEIATFVGARDSDDVVFVRNTTEALNVIAAIAAIPADAAVIATAVEHHANLLPWRRVATTVHVPVPHSPEELLDTLRSRLASFGSGCVIAITGANNVTGEIFPLRDIATLAHDYGARVCVDAAQLAPHRAIDMAALGIDFLALSGHKMYAPFGSGVAVMPHAVAEAAAPLLAGGGAVNLVTLDDVHWNSSPERHEAGSPNVIGGVALAAAARTLCNFGMDRVAAHERMLVSRLVERAHAIPGLHRLTMWPGDHDRVGVFAFRLDGINHALAATALAAEWGIGVRHGWFCAHPYVSDLLGITEAQTEELAASLRDGGERPAMSSAMRASFGIGNRVDDVDRFGDALEALLSTGPQLNYVRDPATGTFEIADDSRPWPSITGMPDIRPYKDASSGCGGRF